MNEFALFVQETMAPFGPVEPRRMFGGYGIFYDDLMIGLIADDGLYLKVDDQTSGLFEGEGLSPFEYDKKGKTVRMSFYQAPEAMFDDPDDMMHWVRLAHEAALRSKRR